MKIMQYLQLLVFLLVASVSAADDSLPDSNAETLREIKGILTGPDIELTDLFRLAELTNPHLAVARDKVQASNGRLRQAGLYPNPELSLALGERSIDNPSFYKQKMELSQTLLIGGRRGAAVDAAQAQMDQAGELVLRERRNALEQVHKWWADQLHFREAKVAFDELLTEAEHNLAIARTRFEARAVPESHVTRAMLERYDLVLARQELEREQVRSTAEMKVIFGGFDVPLDRLSGSLDTDHKTDGLAPENTVQTGEHPLLRAAHLGVAVAEAMLETAQKERIPDLKFFVAFGRERPDNENFVEGGISFPLPLFHRNQGRVFETASLVTKARHEERIVAYEFEAALSVALVTYHTAHGQMLQLTEQITPAAERSLAQAREAYRAGRLMFMELVDAQRTFNEVLLRKLELRRDLTLAEANLMSLHGTGPYADIGENQ